MHIFVHCQKQPVSVEYTYETIDSQERRGHLDGYRDTWSLWQNLIGGPMLSESVFDAFTRSYEARRETDMSVAEYLDLCKKEPIAYANATERLLAAIGEPQMVDTARDARLGRIFMNRTIRVYPAFAGFHGMEETIERIVSFFRHAAQGLEERKQILYLLGPVGGGKSSLAERLK